MATAPPRPAKPSPETKHRLPPISPPPPCALPADTRAKIFHAFASGGAHILVTTDLAARGLARRVEFCVPHGLFQGCDARAQRGGRAWIFPRHVFQPLLEDGGARASLEPPEDG